ncbi:MAG TPA: DNA ligase D [Methylomirabilota bacterium]|nr:DNA ligase D [Methylomirabilota bacterium]
MPAPLDDYRKKRDPARTPEPFGPARAGEGRMFVVQKHAARRLHYDVRLEMDGVLKSWAVPKGPALKAEEKRLAVHVEDHPVEYADFEGIIPEGNYGAGAVIVWDRGWYRLVKDGPPSEQLRAGRLEVELFGHKLRGRWTLARMGGKDKEWLLLKKADGFAGGDEPVERFPESVLSGLTVEEVREGSTRVAALRAALARANAPAGDVDAARQPVMLASVGERAFSDPGWLYELKYDGVRILAARAGGEVALYGRAGQVFTPRYPEIVTALRALPLDRFVLDGEVVALDEQGRPSFQRLQNRMHLARPADVERARSTVPVSAVFFDALTLDGRDLRRLPLSERKACLALAVPARGVIRYGDHVSGQGEAFYEAAAEQRVEGVIAKRADSRYTGGRTRDWLKLKCQLRQEFVIGGWTDPQGARGWFGALHVGVYDGERLVYAGKVGTGFDEAALRRIWDHLQPLARKTSPFEAGSPTGRGHHWVEPTLVCEVRFTEWTEEGGIRHPAFLGLRDDRAPTECRREVGAGPFAQYGIRSGTLPPLPGDTPPAPVARATPEPTGPREARERWATITNPRKIFWPDEGYTKSDLVGYYEMVAPWLLPYLRGRAVVLTRYPDGITGKSFYQKDAPTWVPAWVRTARIRAEGVGRDIDYFVVDDVETLRYVANTGTIPLHLWASRLESLDRPDWLVLDLDPKGAPFTDVVKVALALRALLERLELPSYPKTSGATGLHVLLPLGARYSYEEARTFARLLATLAVEAVPAIATIARMIRTRGGKVYVDFGQNGPGQTIVAPLAVRPLPGAPVSAPLRWPEVTARLDPSRFTIRTAPARLEKLGDPMAPVLGAGVDIAAALARLDRPR